MEVDYLKFVLALIVVIGAIVLLPMLARKFGRLPNLSGGAGSTRRLAVLETLALDARRRLVLIRRDQTEYLLLLGQSSEIVVDKAGAAQPHANRLDTGAAGETPDKPSGGNNISRLSALLKREDRP